MSYGRWNQSRKWKDANRVQQMALRYIDLTDMTLAEFAANVGQPTAAVDRFLRGVKTSLLPWPLVAAIAEFIERRPVTQSANLEVEGEAWATKSAREIADCFKRATLFCEAVLLYGAPGTQKSFTLKRLICEANRAKRPVAIYVYSSADITPLGMLKRIGREVGVPIHGHRERLIASLVLSLREKPLAIVLDEAQHLSVQCLEIAREIAEQSGCGLILAGSHQLANGLTRRKQDLEQLISRMNHRAQLTGLTEQEIRQIAEPLGLSQKPLAALIDGCRVEDIFAPRERGSALPSYFSARRLARQIDRILQHRTQKIAAD